MNVPRFPCFFARIVQIFVCFSLACFILSLPVLAVSRDEWRPVDPADLALKAPVVLEANSYAETARVQLPAGFDVDEMPDAVKIETPFGTYSATYETKDGKLLFTRALTVRAATIPADQYTAVRTFFERIRAAEQAPVVLAKK